MSEEKSNKTDRRTLLQLAALAGIPLAASGVGSAATTGHLGEYREDTSIDYGQGLVIEVPNAGVLRLNNNDIANTMQVINNDRDAIFA